MTLVETLLWILGLWRFPPEPSESGWKETADSTGPASTTQCHVSKMAAVCWGKGVRKAFGWDFLAHGVCLLLAPSAPCSCMSYHHDSRRIFIGQDNGAVVVSNTCSNKLHMCPRLTLGVLQTANFFIPKKACISGLNSIFGLLQKPVWVNFVFVCVCVCLLTRSFLFLKISTRWTMSKRIQVRTWDRNTHLNLFTVYWTQ